MLVQKLAILIVIIVTICGLRNFKSTVIVWTVVQTLLNPQVAIRYESPAMSCMLAVDIMLLLLYFYKKKRLKKKYFSQGQFLLRIPMFVMLFSYVISFLFAPFSSMTGLNSAIKYIITNFGILFLFQKCLSNPKDVNLFIKAAAIVAFIQTGLGLVENIFQDNYWLDFIYYNSPHNDITQGRMYYIPPEITGTLSMRYGMVRSQAFFGIHIAFGFFCLIYFYLFVRNYKENWNFLKKKLLILCIFLLLGGVFMANSKTGYVGLVIMIFALYKPSQIFKPKNLVGFLLVIACIIVLFPEYMMNYYSLFDDSIAEEGGGSTIEIRKLQFETAYRLFLLNPIFGNGIGSTDLLIPLGFEDILGSESSWMQIMPERGFVGALMYLVMYYSLYKTFKKAFGPRPLFFYLLSVLVMETATGQLDIFIWGVPLIVVYKYMMFKMTKQSLHQRILTH